MSDNPMTPEEQGGSKPTPTPPKGTSPLRLVLLLLIFGVALAGLLYDYTIARPSIQKADKIIQSLLDGTQKDPNDDGTVTADEVQTLLGCTPTKTKKLPNGMIETYRWRSGLPYRTYNLYVVYSGQKLPLLHSATTNEEPGADSLPPETKFEKATKEQLENFTPPPVMGAGTGGAPPKGKQGSGGKKRGKGRSGGGSSKSASVVDSVPPTDDEAKQEEGQQEEAKQEEGKVSEPAKDVPPPATEPAKDVPPPATEPAKDMPPPATEPAKDVPPPATEPAKDVPPPQEDPKKTEGDGQ